MKIWFDGELFDVVKIYKPTKFDCYILAQNKVEEQIHEDSKTIPVQMILIDVGNDQFVVDTPKTRKIMKKINDINLKTEEAIKKIRNESCSIWLEDVKKIQGKI